MGWQDGHGGAFGGGSWNGPAHTRGGFGGGARGGSFGGGSGGNSGGPRGTGLTTGSTWYGNTAFGQPGGMAQGYATRGANGQFGNFRSLSGAPMQGGFTSANGFPGIMQQRTPINPASMPMPSSVTGALPPSAALPPVARPYVGVPPSVMPPAPPPRMGPWPGQSAIPPNPPVWNQQRVTTVPKTNFGGYNPGQTYTANDIRREPGMGGGYNR